MSPNGFRAGLKSFQTSPISLDASPKQTIQYRSNTRYNKALIQVNDYKWHLLHPSGGFQGTLPRCAVKLLFQGEMEEILTRVETDFILMCKSWWKHKTGMQFVNWDSLTALQSRSPAPSSNQLAPWRRSCFTTRSLRFLMASVVKTSSSWYSMFISNMNKAEWRNAYIWQWDFQLIRQFNSQKQSRLAMTHNCAYDITAVICLMAGVVVSMARVVMLANLSVV